MDRATKPWLKDASQTDMDVIVCAERGERHASCASVAATKDAAKKAEDGLRRTWKANQPKAPPAPAPTVDEILEEDNEDEAKTEEE